MIWNGIIRAVYISFAQILFTSSIQAKMLQRKSRYADDLTYVVVVSCAIYIVVVLATMIFTINKYKAEFSKSHIKKVYENLYTNVNHKRGGCKIYYWVYFIARRTAFFSVPIIWSMPMLQLQVLCFFTSLYVILIAYIRPHLDKKGLRLEIFNEVMLMVSTYHMFCFTEFNLDDMQKYNMGHSYVFWVAGTFMYNVGLMITKNVERYKRKKRMEKARDNFLIHQHEILRKEHVERLFEGKKKSAGSLLANQFKKQEEQRMIKQMEKAYLSAKTGHKASSAAEVMSGKKAKRSQSLKNDRPKVKAERQNSHIDFSPSPQLKNGLDVIKEETHQTEEDEQKDKNPFVAEFPVRDEPRKVSD
jgi:hypothetical protein